MGSSGQPRVVTLHPKESCSCPSNATCYQILAARLSIGETGNDAPEKKINLTQLYKNAGGKKEKKSGRKKPRLGDYEIYPVPDANVTYGKSYAICHFYNIGADSCLE